MLIRAGQTITSPQRMADELNQNYIVSAAKTRQNIPKNCGDPLVNFKKLTEGKDLNLVFQPIRRHELYKIISSINPSKSSALDGISMKFLNQIKEPLIEVLLHLVNSSIIQSKYLSNSFHSLILFSSARGTPLVAPPVTNLYKPQWHWLQRCHSGE